jgi:tryptophanyl-tRNA synthetase
MQLVSAPDTIAHFDEAYNNCSIRYGDLKKQLAEDMVQFHRSNPGTDQSHQRRR